MKWTLLLTALTVAPAIASAKEIVVAPPQSIQAAVDAAAPGDTIRVAAGNYREQVIVAKDLTLRGNPGATIEAPDGPLVGFDVILGFPPPAPTSEHLTGVLTVVNSDAAVSGLTVDGRNTFDVHPELLGIVYLNSGGSISHCEVKNIATPAYPTLPPLNQDGSFGSAILAWNPSDTSRQIEITHNFVHHFVSTGIWVTGLRPQFRNMRVRATIQDNIVLGAGPSDVRPQWGIFSFGGTAADVTGNQLSDFVFTGPGGGEPSQAIICGPQSPHVEHNVITHAQKGIFAFLDDGASVSHNQITGPAVSSADPLGILVIGDRFEVADNQVDYRDPTGSTTATCFTVVGNDADIHDNVMMTGGPSGDAPSWGRIVMFGNGDRNRFRNNSVTNLWRGPLGAPIDQTPASIYVFGANTQVTGNLFQGPGSDLLEYAALLTGANAQVFDNHFVDFPVGIRLFDFPSPWDPSAPPYQATNAQVGGNSFENVTTRILADEPYLTVDGH
jgi:hypothetical protein